MIEELHYRIECNGHELDCILNSPKNRSARGALILHPHPRYGGTMHNDVVQATVNACSNLGIDTFRFNFSGATPSKSVYRGEQAALDEAICAMYYFTDLRKIEKLGVIGYSFGGSVALAVATKFELDFLITLSASISILYQIGISDNDLRHIICPALTIHGMVDKVVPPKDLETISSVLPNSQSLKVPNEGHFYTSMLGSVIEEIDDFFMKLSNDYP